MYISTLYDMVIARPDETRDTLAGLRPSGLSVAFHRTTSQRWRFVSQKTFFFFPPPHPHQYAYIHTSLYDICGQRDHDLLLSIHPPPPSPPSLFLALVRPSSQPGLGNAADWGTKTAAVRILRASALVTKWPAYCTLVKKQIPYRYDMKWFLTCLLLG